MKRKYLVFTVILLLVCMNVTGSIIQDTKEVTNINFKGDTLYVGGSGPNNYTKIQDALDNTSDGDTVFVYNDSSPYSENLDIIKSISLVGENQNSTIIDGNRWGDGITIRAENVTIKDLTIQNFSNGIEIHSNNSFISNNNIIKNGEGLVTMGYYYDIHNITISKNTISNNGYGYRIFKSNRNTINDNKIISNYYHGVYISSSHNNFLDNNNFINNGLEFSYSFQNTVLNNTVNGKSLVYFENESDKVIDDAGQVILINCTNMTVQNLNISNSTNGIFLFNTHNCNIFGNKIYSYKGIGILLDSSNNNTFISNNISNNQVGIYLLDSNNSYIFENSFINNGILFYYSFQNTVLNNTVNGKSLVYFENESDKVIDDAGQVILINCTNMTVQNLNISNSTNGIFLLNTFNCLIFNNIINSNVLYDIIFIESINNYIILNNLSSENTYGIYLSKSSGNTITDNAISEKQIGISLGSYSDNNVISGNRIISSKYEGISLYKSNNNNISKNNISKNRVGIEFFRSDKNIISDNAISNNGHDSSGEGVNLRDSNNNNFTGNIFSKNYRGIDIENDCSYNSIYHNCFINNSQNAYDGGGNMWDNGYPCGGNYWDDYIGNDSNGDGIGDTPYLIPGGDNEDRYPFMDPNGWDDNYPPVLIDFKGPSYGKPGIEYSFEVKLLDPDEDSFYCMFDWGDESYSSWLGPINSYEIINMSHSWSMGEYTIRLLTKDIHGVQRNWSFEIFIEDLIPKVEITKPVNALYIINRKIFPFFILKPLIIGNIDITVDAIDSSGIERVYFYIDEELVSDDNCSPYTFHWTWDKITLLQNRYTLKVIGIDNAGNLAQDEIKVRKFL